MGASVGRGTSLKPNTFRRLEPLGRVWPMFFSQFLSFELSLFFSRYYALGTMAFFIIISLRQSTTRFKPQNSRC